MVAPHYCGCLDPGVPAGSGAHRLIVLPLSYHPPPGVKESIDEGITYAIFIILFTFRVYFKRKNPVFLFFFLSYSFINVWRMDSGTAGTQYPDTLPDNNVGLSFV